MTPEQLAARNEAIRLAWDDPLRRALQRRQTLTRLGLPPDHVPFDDDDGARKAWSREYRKRWNEAHPDAEKLRRLARKAANPDHWRKWPSRQKPKKPTSEKRKELQREYRKRWNEAHPDAEKLRRLARKAADPDYQRKWPSRDPDYLKRRRLVLKAADPDYWRKWPSRQKETK